MMLSRALAGWLSPAGPRGSLSILIFHRVTALADPLFPAEPDADRFDRILRWVGKTFSVLPLDQAAGALRRGTLPARALSITFDDGYEDNASVALPILVRHRMTATFFIASRFIDGGRMWNDTVIEAVRGCRMGTLDLSSLDLGVHRVATLDERRQAIARLLPALKYRSPHERLERVNEIARLADAPLPDDLMMTSAQLRHLRASGMQIGGHTRTHPILARSSDRAAEDEIAGGKADLESILGQPVTLFAYPNGKPGKDYRMEHVRMVMSAGFDVAVSTSTGVARPDTDRYQLPRFTPWDRSELRFSLRLVDNLRARARVAAA